ncbi:MAG TPA: hypothetical protein VGJ13_03110 [Pseudonocardiaceae bacterium]
METLRRAQVPDALFTTEDEACDYVHARLTELPPPAPDAAERIAEILADRDEIQRDAKEAPHRALREDGAPGRGGEPPPR